MPAAVRIAALAILHLNAALRAARPVSRGASSGGPVAAYPMEHGMPAQIAAACDSVEAAGVSVPSRPDVVVPDCSAWPCWTERSAGRAC